MTVAFSSSDMAIYTSQRPIKTMASESQQTIDRLQDENRKLRARVKDLEKKLGRVGASTEEAPDISKDLAGDQVMRTMLALIRKVEKERADITELSLIHI